MIVPVVSLALSLLVGASSFAGPALDTPTRTTTSDRSLQLAARRAACGFNCIYMLLRLAGKDVDSKKLEEHLPVSNAGNSMLGLKQACEEMELPSTIIRTTVEDLHKLQMPLIVLTNSSQIDELTTEEAGVTMMDYSQIGHYFLVTDATEDQVNLIDGTTGDSFTMAPSEFQPGWVEAALVQGTPRTSNRWLLVMATIATLFTIAVYTFFPAVGPTHSVTEPKP